MRYRLTRAADLADAAYTGKAHDIIGYQWKASLNVDDVQAHMLRDNTLLIPGSDGVMDYVLYNLRIRTLGKSRLRLAHAPKNVTWHQGFLAHAKIIQDWLMEAKLRPSFVIGHSLGAASAQILSAGWRIPAIAFAAPRTCRTRYAPLAAPHCLCINRSDDRICGLPDSFQHIGTVQTCTPRVENPGLDHAMIHYKRAVQEGIARRSLPEVWPRV